MLFAIFAIFGIFIIALFIHIIILGALFEPTQEKELKTIIEFLNPQLNEKIADLGSGNGKLVIALAKRGAHVHGYEINPLLVFISKYKIKKLRLKNAYIYQKNFWNVNLKDYDSIVLFQTPFIMESLEKKLNAELKPKTKIISNTWKFPHWKTQKQKGKVYFYQT